VFKRVPLDVFDQSEHLAGQQPHFVLSFWLVAQPLEVNERTEIEHNIQGQLAIHGLEKSGGFFGAGAAYLAGQLLEGRVVKDIARLRVGD
jgi:hypothetical protein